MSLLGSRAAGVLCPISALPGPHGIGDLGSAIRFLDFLERGAQGVWQVLPVHPTTSIAGNSPYTSLSAFALDPLLLAADPLVAAGWLDVDDVGASMTGGPVDFDAARARRRAWLDTAWRRLADGATR